MLSKLKIKLKRKIYPLIELGSHYINPSSRSFKLLNLAYKKIALPYILKIHINNKCNLNDCKHCYIKKDSSELKTAKVLEIINQASDTGFRRIDILGGEPLLREDIFDIIRHAKNKGLTVCLFTNASLVTKTIAKELKKAGLDICIVGSGSLNNRPILPRRVEGIKKLVKEEVNTKILTVMTSENIKKLEEIKKFSENLGAKAYFLRYIPKSKNDQLLRISYHEWQSVLFWLMKDTGKTYWKNIILPKMVLQGGFCCGGSMTLSINSKGDVNPCVFVDYKLGNVYKERLDEILIRINSKDYKEFMDHPEECKECKLLKICGGGCKAISKVIYGSYLKKDPYCRGPYQDVDINKLEDYLPNWDI